MTDGNGLRITPHGAVAQEIQVPGNSSDANRSLRSVTAESARAGALVRGAGMLLEKNRPVARSSSTDTSMLSASVAQEFAVGVPVTRNGPGGLARRQIRLALTYVEANLESKFSVADLAAAVRCSKSHFSRTFKRSLGLPPMAYVTTRRVARAKLMMSSTREQLVEIALACGFVDQSHLTRSFRRMVGVAPGLWRRSNVEHRE
jgi:AraC-like DNA-binding protein